MYPESEFEGNWKDFYIRASGVSDLPVILEHLRGSYYLEEPCHKALGWCETKAKDLDILMGAYLNHNLSLCAFDRHTPGKLAGVRIVIDSRTKLDAQKLRLKSPHCPKIMRVKDKLVELAKEYHLNNKTEFCPKYLDLNEEFATANVASVGAEYRQLGLMGEMHRRSLIQIKASGLNLMKSFFSSDYTRKIADKIGYTEISRLYLGDRFGPDGEPDFPPEAKDILITYHFLKF